MTGNPIATYDFWFGKGQNEELVLRGEEVICPGTGAMNAREHAASLVRQGAAVWPDDKRAAILRGDAA
jgi:hypothetical protein